jgi:hypothetical protein
MSRRLFVALPVALTLALPAFAQAQVPDLTVPAARDTEPVILTGKDLAGWAVPNETTVRLPLWDYVECPGSIDPSAFSDPTEGGAEGAAAGLLFDCPEGVDPHSHYGTPQVDTSKILPVAGKPVGRLLGYRWDGTKFVQIPFQVDEVFTRYLNNTASGFAIYSGEDRHTTYAYDGPGDREGFRYTTSDPSNPCVAKPASPAASDPVKGLDTDDEVAFMASDAGGKAPAGAALPAGIESAKEIAVADPVAGATRYAYVMLAAAGGPAPAYTAANGYVRYQRDPGADIFALSESSYESYGAAKPGVYCDAAGNLVRDANGQPKIGQRRPRDGATITTGRYKFRYDGRWLMTAIQVRRPGGDGYGDDLVDRWKARAFAQDPASETPCCGYEEEDNNWGGSSILLGERVGPVRAVRETWGADSGTNVIRREIFYREEMRQNTYLRVHPIPPLDGIYAQWDFNAGKVDRFYSSTKKGGVAVDGRNDEVFGNFDDPCNVNWDANDTSAIDQGYRSLYRQFQLCNFPYHQSVDVADPTFSEANAGFGWAVTAGDQGSIVDRISVSAAEVTPGGIAQSLLGVPYYRDDSCFDDGTGTDPGPHLNPRSGDEPRTVGGVARKCWTPQDGDPQGSPRFFQGSIATHGVHFLTVLESDNARLTVPLTEINGNWRMVMLPGRHGAEAGERYGRGFEKPLVAVARPFGAPALLNVNLKTPLGTTNLRIP